MTDRTRDDLAALGLTDDEINQELASQAEDLALAQQGGDAGVAPGGDPAGMPAGGDGTADPAAAAPPVPAPSTEGTPVAGQQPAPAPAAPPVVIPPVAATQEQPAVAAAPAVQPAAPEEPDPLVTRQTELSAQMEKLEADFDNAELTAAEYRAALKPIEAELRRIDREQIEAGAVERFRQEQVVQAWGSTVRGFLDTHPEYKPGSLLYGALDAAVQRQQAVARAAGRDANSVQVLQDAHAALRAEMGLDATTPQPAAQPAAPPQPAAPQPPINRPPTLGGIPAAATNNTDVSEFAALDRIANTPDDPEAFERAMRRMTPEQRERYLAGG